MSWVADESVLSGDVVEKGGTTVFCEGTKWDLGGGLSGYLLMVDLIYITLAVPTGFWLRKMDYFGGSFLDGQEKYFSFAIVKCLLDELSIFESCIRL